MKEAGYTKNANGDYVDKDGNVTIPSIAAITHEEEGRGSTQVDIRRDGPQERKNTFLSRKSETSSSQKDEGAGDKACMGSIGCRTQ